jgi:hypothetical protein
VRDVYTTAYVSSGQQSIHSRAKCLKFKSVNTIDGGAKPQDVAPPSRGEFLLPHGGSVSWRTPAIPALITDGLTPQLGGGTAIRSFCSPR